MALDKISIGLYELSFSFCSLTIMALFKSYSGC